MKIVQNSIVLFNRRWKNMSTFLFKTATFPPVTLDSFMRKWFVNGLHWIHLFSSITRPCLCSSFWPTSTSPSLVHPLTAWSTYVRSGRVTAFCVWRSSATPAERPYSCSSTRQKVSKVLSKSQTRILRTPAEFPSIMRMRTKRRWQ